MNHAKSQVPSAYDGGKCLFTLLLFASKGFLVMQFYSNPLKMISTGEHSIVKFDQKTHICIHVHLRKIDAINQKVYIYTQHILYRHPPWGHHNILWFIYRTFPMICVLLQLCKIHFCHVILYLLTKGWHLPPRAANSNSYN